MRLFIKVFLAFIFCVIVSCVERIDFDLEIGSSFPIAIEGHISTDPGPYEVRINKSFDLEAKQSPRQPLSVRKVVISDNTGTIETLTKVDEGRYETSPSGIRGEIGKAYSITVELLDGRVYRSIPDTIKSPGLLDSIYYDFNSVKNSAGGTEYGFDVFFDSRAMETKQYHFMWKFTGTFQIETNPENFTVACGESRCPAPLSCSAYALIGGQVTEVDQCECCTCWVDVYNDLPLLSDNRFITDGEFTNVFAYRLPLDKWVLQKKARIQVEVWSITRTAFQFWKGVKDQKEANSSLFQPISGKIIGNFEQMAGESGLVEGLFYAASIDRKSTYITRESVVPQTLIPPQDIVIANACSTVFPNSTAQKPSNWID